MMCAHSGPTHQSIVPALLLSCCLLSGAPGIRIPKIPNIQFSNLPPVPSPPRTPRPGDLDTDYYLHSALDTTAGSRGGAAGPGPTTGGCCPLSETLLQQKQELERRRQQRHRQRGHSRGAGESAGAARARGGGCGAGAGRYETRPLPDRLLQTPLPGARPASDPTSYNEFWSPLAPPPPLLSLQRHAPCMARRRPAGPPGLQRRRGAAAAGRNVGRRRYPHHGHGFGARQWRGSGLRRRHASALDAARRRRLGVWYVASAAHGTAGARGLGSWPFGGCACKTLRCMRGGGLQNSKDTQGCAAGGRRCQRWAHSCVVLACSPRPMRACMRACMHARKHARRPFSLPS